MKKRLLLIALCVIFTLGMTVTMTGCGGSGGGSDESTLTFWTHNDEDT